MGRRWRKVEEKGRGWDKEADGGGGSWLKEREERGGRTGTRTGRRRVSDGEVIQVRVKRTGFMIEGCKFSDERGKVKKGGSVSDHMM